MLYTNVLAVPVMAGLLLASDDWQRARALAASPGGVPLPGLLLLAAGCVVGTGISYAGWLCRSKCSASTRGAAPTPRRAPPGERGTRVDARRGGP